MLFARSLIGPATAAGIGGLIIGLTKEEAPRCGPLDMVGIPTSERVSSLESRLNSLEVKAAVSTHAAFVFVKPHAAGSDAVVDLVKNGLNKAGIAIASEGELSGATIDEQKLIDIHYGAIASKATSVKPAALNPPAKAKAAFEKAFGKSWQAALDAGEVYNAMDACAKLGVDGDAMDGKWATLNRGVNLIKFGGGFYCGQVDGIFVINGFYMAMRGKYTGADAKIRFFTTEWDADKLSWEDFRNKVLGGTDPKDAASGSLRKVVFTDWKKLGLAAEPDVGDNGVHASASPFEAMAERNNWCGQDIKTDVFGAGMLASGIPEATIVDWSSDPQVEFEGKKQSLFDLLEDLNARDCLEKAKKIAGL